MRIAWAGGILLIVLTLSGCRAMVGGVGSTPSPAALPTASPVAPSPAALATASLATASPAAQPTHHNKAFAATTPPIEPTAPLAQAPGCGSVELPPLGPEEAYVPGRLVPLPRVLAAGEIVASIDTVRSRGFDALLPDDLPVGLLLQVISVEPGAFAAVNEVRLYYAPTPIGETTRLTDVIAEGGMLIVQRRAAGVDAALVQEEIGDRALIVDVGPHDAALVWADPLAKGVRPYNLYWSDGERDWSLIAGLTTPESVVAVARSIYCGAV